MCDCRLGLGEARTCQVAGHLPNRAREVPWTVTRSGRPGVRAAAGHVPVPLTPDSAQTPPGAGAGAGQGSWFLV